MFLKDNEWGGGRNAISERGKSAFSELAGGLAGLAPAGVVLRHEGVESGVVAGL